MIVTIGEAVLQRIEADAERRYPEEACGLLVGWRLADGLVEIGEGHPSANLAEKAREWRFEIDPALRFRLMRALSGRPETIVGHYHSHPDRPAVPSARDRSMAFEPDLVWLITAVVAGRAVETAAFRIDGTGVQRLELRIGGDAAGEP